MNSFALSLAAVDILSESLRLGPSPFPFEVPHNAQSTTQRAGIREAVLTDLAQRGLAESGRVEPEVEESLATVYSSEIALTSVALFEDGRQLSARVSSSNGSAVRAVLDGQLIHFDWVRPSALVQAVVELLPDERPALDQSITITSGTEKSAKPEGAQFAKMVRAPKTGRAAQLAAARAILERPRTRIGQLGIILRGTRNPVPELGWFDTDAGRYLTQASTGDDGKSWVTYAPADNAKLSHLLQDQLTRALAEG
jgi:hypothetical protein